MRLHAFVFQKFFFFSFSSFFVGNVVLETCFSKLLSLLKKYTALIFLLFQMLQLSQLVCTSAIPDHARYLSCLGYMGYFGNFSYFQLFLQYCIFMSPSSPSTSTIFSKPFQAGRPCLSDERFPLLRHFGRFWIFSSRCFISFFSLSDFFFILFHSLIL